MNLSESFRASLKALEDAGLDVVALSSFYFANAYEDYRWPDVALEEFFIDRMKKICPFYGPFRASFFKSMGILDSHLDKVVEEYATLKFPEDLLTVLVNSYCGFARPLELGTTLVQAVARLDPSFIDPHASNFDALLNARAPTVSVKIQKRGSNGLPSFDDKDLLVVDELPLGPEYLYHTTTFENDVNIIKNGPFVLFSRFAVDFDGAFYLNTDPGEVEYWADKRAAQSEHKTSMNPVATPGFLSHTVIRWHLLITRPLIGLRDTFMP